LLFDSEQARIQSTVVEVRPEKDIKLKLQSNCLVLPSDLRVRRVMVALKDQKGNLTVVPHRGLFRPINKFKLRKSVIPNELIVRTTVQDMSDIVKKGKQDLAETARKLGIPVDVVYRNRKKTNQTDKNLQH